MSSDRPHREQSPPPISRRSLAAGLGGGLAAGLGGVVLWRFLDWRPPPPAPQLFEPLPQPAGQRPVLRQAGQILLVQQGERAWALSARCSHLGCGVSPADDGQGLICPCHGSRYDLSGAPLRGPAEEPLAPLHVEALPDGGFRVRQR